MQIENQPLNAEMLADLGNRAAQLQHAEAADRFTKNSA